MPTKFPPATLIVQDSAGNREKFHDADYSIDRFGKLVIGEDGNIRRIYNHDGWDWVDCEQVVQ